MSRPCCLEGWFERKLIELTIQGKHNEVLSMIDDVSLDGIYMRGRNNLLHIAAQHNNIELVKRLPCVASKLNVKNSLGYTPLITAIIHGNYELAKYLYSTQVKEKLKDYSSDYIESWLVIELHHRLCKTQLSSAEIGVAIAKITYCQFYDVVRFHNPIVTENYFQTTTAMGRYVNFIGVVEIIVDKHDWPHLEVILRLASTRTRMALTWYSTFWSYIMARICEINKSKSGRQFLEGMFNSRIFTEETLQPLEAMLMTSEIKHLKVFLQYDFPSVVKDQYGRYILASIFGNPSPNVISLLNSEQIDVNGRSHFGKTALHFAAEKGLIDNVKLLIQKGANPNAVDENGRTPLSLAVQKEDFEICVKMLLFAGANPLLISGEAELTKQHFYKEYLTKSNQCVIAQILIYEALGQNIKKPDKLFASWSDDNYDEFVGDCRRQLNELKMHRILDTQMTMFTIFSERPEKLARFAIQEDVQAILTFAEHNEKVLIPYYSELLKNRAEDIAWMQSYRERAIDIVCQIIGILDPHHLVVKKIVDYFDVNDFRKLSEVECRSPSRKNSLRQDLSLVNKSLRLLKRTKSLIPKF